LITEKQLIEMNASNLGEALQNKSGIYLKDYGTSAGLKTISIRGTSPEQTLVLVNGSRLNNFQNSLVDFSLIPTENIERVEILEGGNSALYGADAVGGVINVLTSKPTDKFKLNLQSGVGSYGYRKYLLSLSDRVGSLGLGLSYHNEKGKDNYKYKLKDTMGSVVKERENSDFKRDNLYFTSDYNFNKYQFQLNTSYTNSSHGVPGSLSYLSRQAVQHDKNSITHLSVASTYAENINFKLNSSFLYTFQNYQDPLWSINLFSKYFHYSVNSQVEYSLGDTMVFIVGGQFTKGKLDGTDYLSKVNREQKSIYVISNIIVITDNKEINKIILYPAINYEKYSNSPGEILPKIGLSIAFLNQFNLRSSYGLNYRIPTLNELYYRDNWGNTGNINLKPEYSQNFDAGLRASIEYIGNLVIDMSYFRVNTIDKIIWLPTSNYTSSPENIGKVLSRGFSGKMNWFLNKNIEIEASHNITDVRKKNRDSEKDPTYDKQLIYVPRNVSKIGLNIRCGFISLNINNLFVSTRFIDEADTRSLPPYNVLNGNILVNIPFSFGKIWFKTEVNNVANRDYQVMYEYPMPLRNYKFSLGFEF
jgi:outer membrane cobalamin receptor